MSYLKRSSHSVQIAIGAVEFCLGACMCVEMSNVSLGTL